MFRIVLLMIAIMAGVFVLVTNIAAKKTHQPTINPIAEIGRGLRNGLNNADRLAPDLSGALKRAETDLKIDAKPSTTPADDAARNFAGADFSGQTKTKATFASAALTKAHFINTLLDGATFEGANGEEVDFAKAQLGKASLDASVLRRSDFTGAALRGARA